MRRPNRILTALCCIALLAFVQGCAVINPYVSADDSAVAAQPTLANAVAYAEATRNEYECAVSEYTWMNRTVGVTLIGAAAAAAAVGISGGSTDVVTGLAVGGAGLFGIDRLLYREPRLRAYLEGSRAIGCTLAAFGPLRVADQNELEPLLTTLARQLDVLETALNAAPADIAGSFDVVRGRLVLIAGKETLARGRAAQRAIAGAGIRLYESVEGIRSEVNKALLSSEPDVQELVQGLGQFIPANAALIAPPRAAAPAPTAAPTGTAARAFEAERSLIRAATDAVEQVRADVENVLARMGTEPMQEQLTSCAFDSENTGVNFRVAPDMLTLYTGDGPTTGVIALSGGKGIYRARWFGTPPEAKITLEPIDHQGGAGNLATVTIKAEQNAASGTYNLQISHEGGGIANVQVIVLQDNKPATTVTPKPTSPAKDRDLENAQAALIELKCMPPLQASGESSADGIWGPATASAVDKFSAAIESSPEELKATIGTWGDEDFTKKLLGLLATAKEQRKLCAIDTAAPAPAAPAPDA